MSDRDLLRVVLEDAELQRYEHGGARLMIWSKDGERELIADFYGDGEWREFFMDLVQAESKRRAGLETKARLPAGIEEMARASNLRNNPDEPV